MLGKIIAIVFVIYLFIVSADCIDDDEDAYLIVPQLIVKYGYPLETHYITTEDGYIVTVFRIPFGRNVDDSVSKKPPVLVVHGLFGSASDFVLQGPDNALGYLLADNGYDVWLMNCRGNRYSMNHTKMSSKNRKFWNYSFHDIGVYDIPAAIDYIIKASGYSKIFHIGHSQGCTTFYAMLSERPQYNEKIIAHFGYAPAAFVCYINQMMRWASVPEIMGHYTNFRNQVGDFNIGPNEIAKMLNLGKICREKSPAFNLCLNLLTTFADLTYNQINHTMVKIILGHYPAGGSSKQLVHYAQGINSCEFKHYRNNIMETPTNYNLTNIQIPVFAFSGQHDSLQRPKDTKRLKKELPNGFKKLVYLKDWAHNDFVLGIDAKKLVYSPTIDFLDEETKIYEAELNR